MSAGQNLVDVGRRPLPPYRPPPRENVFYIQPQTDGSKRTKQPQQQPQPQQQQQQPSLEVEEKPLELRNFSGKRTSAHSEEPKLNPKDQVSQSSKFFIQIR